MNQARIEPRHAWRNVLAVGHLWGDGIALDRVPIAYRRRPPPAPAAPARTAAGVAGARARDKAIAAVTNLRTAETGVLSMTMTFPFYFAL
jgi:hypothetical protein